MYACNGILFNHESKRRGETFVTRKITRGLARVSLGLEKYLYLGNLEATNGGTNPHFSTPLLADIACKIPLFEPT